MRNCTYDGNLDYAREFTEIWNKKVKSIRKTSIVVAAVMIVLGIVCIAFPVQAVRVVEVIAAIVIAVLGVVQIIDYCNFPIPFQRAGTLVNGILNILIGILLLCSPSSVSIGTFAFMFGFLLLIFGIDLLALSGKLRFFGIGGCGWVVATGIVGLVAAAAFFILPLASTIALNYILAIYLIAGGAVILVESTYMKDLQMK